MTPHAKLNRATKAGATKAEHHLPSLTRAYGRALRAAGRRAATQLTHTETVTAAAVPKPPDWQPPPIDQILNAQELAADTQRKTAKLHRTILTAAASTALEPFGISFDIKAATSQAALDAVAKRIQTGISQAITAEITNAILNGYAEGHSVARVASAIRAATDQISRPRADMLARTDLVALANAGSHIAASQIDGVTTKTWLATEDERTRETHADADGQTVPIDGQFTVGDETCDYPGDPVLSDQESCNCVPAWQIGISVRATARVMRSWRGQLTQIVTTGNNELAATPNHPVFTRDGWRAIGTIEPGDYVLCCTKARAAAGPIDPDETDSEVTAEEVASAIEVSARGRKRMVPRFMDFDGETIDRDVEVVRTDEPLSFGLYAEQLEELREFSIHRSHSEMRLPGDLAALGLVAEPEITSLGSRPSMQVQILQNLDDRAARDPDLFSHSEHRGIESVEPSNVVVIERPPHLRGPRRKAAISQRFGNGPFTKAQSPADRADRQEFDFMQLSDGVGKFYAGLAPFAWQEVTSVNRQSYEGQVYDFESTAGSFSADGIVLANCRCSLVYGEELATDAETASGSPDDLAIDETGSVPARVHYRPADDPAEACGTCAYYTAATARCTMFQGDPAVLADYTCDEWVAETAEVGITSGGAMSVIDVETLTAEERAELRERLDQPLSPLAAKMAAVRAALTANGAADTFGDDELRAVIVTLEALSATPTLTLEDAVLLAATEGGTPWQATLCVAGQPTVDSGMKRLLDREGGSWLPLPLPLAIMDDSPHADMVTSSPMCGRIDQIWMAGDVCQASGVFFDSSDDPEVAAAGSRAAAIVQEMRRMGISVDLVDTEVELVRWQDSGEMLDPVNDPTADGPDASYGDFPDGEIVEVIYDEADEPEYVYLFRKWVIAGATICPVQALTQATISLVASAFDGRGEWRTVTEFVAPAAPALTAGAAGMVPLEPPAAWFDDPSLDGPTPLTITDEGRVFGHLAAWDTCHTGRPGCTPPPRSPSGYMNFHLGELVTAEGTRVAVGTLTFDAPHASLPLSASQAVRHYDDTATAGAHVRAGEDAYGIWLAGALNPRLSAEEARTLMAAPPSGDWRQVQSGQGRDLVGAHAVNQPGFIVQRRGLSLAASAEDCGPCEEALARELDVLAASADGLEALAALVS